MGSQNTATGSKPRRSWRPVAGRGLREIGSHSARRLSAPVLVRAFELRRPGQLRAVVACAILTGSALFAMTTDGGRRIRAATPFAGDVDAVAAELGLGLYQISVSGHRMTPDSDVFEAVQAGQSRSLLLFDTKAARERIEKLPWVGMARVARVFPDELRVFITERTPLGKWRDSGRDMLFDAGGRWLGPAATGSYPELPIVGGAQASTQAPELYEELSKFPEIRRRLARAEWIGLRRWRLLLDDARVIELPEYGWSDALAVVSQRHSWGRLLDRKFAVLDLRIAGQIIIRVDDKVGGQVAGRL